MSAPRCDSSYLRHDEGALLDIATHLVAAAGKRGFAAAAQVNESAGLTVTARGGRIETQVGDQSQRLTLTVYDGARRGHAGSGRFDAESLAAVLDRASALARFGGEDPDRALPPEEALAMPPRVVPLMRSSEWSVDTLAGHATALEHGALEAGVAAAALLIVDEAGAQSHDHRVAIAASNGFAASYGGSSNARWCTVAAGDEGGRRLAGSVSSQRDCTRLRSPETIARDAASRAIARLAPRPLSSRRAAMLFENKAAAELVGTLAGALSGGAQIDAATFLPDALGKAVAADHLTLSEDPFLPFGDASAPFDGQGIAGRQRTVVENGVATGYFLDMRAARRLGLPATGNADGPSNLRLTSRLTDPGDDLAAMLATLGTGLFVTGVSGQGINRVTGDYSRAAHGFWVDGGEIAYPVEGLTIVGNLKTMFTDIVALGADVPDDGAIRCGSMLIDRLDIAA